MKVLLTGGSGNLGQALVPRLLDKGDTPVILDARAPASLKEGAAFIEGSVLDRSKLTEIVRGCDGIVHIAPGTASTKTAARKTRTIFSISMCAAPSRFSKLLPPSESVK